MSPSMMLELARVAECDARTEGDAEQIDYLYAIGAGLRADVIDMATERLAAYLATGGTIQIAIGPYSDMAGRHSDATATAQRYSTVSYSPGCPSGRETVHDTAEDAACAFVLEVGVEAIFAWLEGEREQVAA